MELTLQDKLTYITSEAKVYIRYASEQETEVAYVSNNGEDNIIVRAESFEDAVEDLYNICLILEFGSQNMS